MNVNKVILVGRLGRDPEIKTLTSGKTLTTLSLGVSESWTDQSGQKQEETEWVRVKLFGKVGEVAGKYLKKGSIAYVEGSMKTSSWEGQDGQKKYSTEVIGKALQMGPRNNNSADTKTVPMDFGPEPNFDSSEEIPF